jgi:NCS1 family nucleobase:cation symporter-1
LIFPWKLIADPNGYIFTWLIAYSSLLGPVGGIMIVDYFFIRKKELQVDDLYQEGGQYSYGHGYNSKALIALMVGILPNLPGFLLQIKLIAPDAFPAFVNQLYNYAWFVGFGVSGLVYGAGMKRGASSHQRRSE